MGAPKLIWPAFRDSNLYRGNVFAALTQFNFSSMRQILILLAIVLFCPSFTYAQEKTGAEQRRIREIRVFIETIYTEEQAEKSSWADFANRFHTPTRESVIKTDLLFKEGDVLDEELLKQSERRLRRFQFLNKAEVKVVPVDNKTVDVEVYTKDAWSLVPGMNIKGGGDLYTISAHLMEVNLLGYGKKLYAEGIYESDVGTTWKFGYSDYQLFNSRWIGNAVYQTGPLIESAFLQARLPLYSIDSVWSYGGSVYSADQIIRHFENGDESSRFAKDQVRLEAYMTRSFGERYKKTNLKFSLKYLEADYSTLGAQTTVPPPPDQINITPTVRLSTENIKWDKFTYIDKMGPVEDNWLGIRYGGKVGYGFPLEGGFELWDVGANAHKNTTFAMISCCCSMRCSTRRWCETQSCLVVPGTTRSLLGIPSPRALNCRRVKILIPPGNSRSVQIQAYVVILHAISRVRSCCL